MNEEGLLQRRKPNHLFGHWKTSSDSSPSSPDIPSRQLNKNLTVINAPDFEYGSASESLKSVIERHDFALLGPLFEYIFCTPSTSAPVERISSHSGLVMRPSRARMYDKILEMLVFCHCNNKLI
jgi:hypothetical protein